MINVDFWLDKSGCLYRIDASGHSGSAEKGRDIICAAASVLLRTASRALEMEPTINLDGSRDTRGELHLEIQTADITDRSWLKGISTFILVGFKDLASEFPDYCTIKIMSTDHDKL